MNNFNMNDTRSRRNLLNWTGIFPFQSVANYSSDSSKMKMDIKNNFGEDLYLKDLHLIPDPLKKNLADSIITGKVKTNMASETKTFVKETQMKDRGSEDHRTEYSPPLGGITNFLSGVMNFVSGLAMFHKRTDSPTQYYECFEQSFDGMAPSLQAWHIAKPEVQNKNGRAHNDIISTNEPIKVNNSTMNASCRIAAAQCENKLNQVHVILQNPHLQYQSQLHSESPKVYVEQSSIEDFYEDAFTCEDFETLPDQTYLEYFGQFSNQNPDLLISDAPRIQNEYMPLTENMEITSTLTPDVIKDNVCPDKISFNSEIDGKIGHEPQIVEACEDKMNKLKALLQEKRKNKSRNEINNSVDNIDTVKNNDHQTKPITIPNSNNNKKTMKSNKQEDSISKNDVFWNESVDENVSSLGTLPKSTLDDQDCSDSSPEYLDPCNYFDEVTGKFYSASVESDDSFQTVFTDSPKSCRGRIPSECDSEDSFIVFEDNPDSCYSSKDVFGDELYVDGFNEMESSSDSDSDEECDDSDSESDSGCDAFNQTCKLSHSLTRTIGDLTDDSLYEVGEDEVDCAAVFVQEKHIESTPDEEQINLDNIEVDSNNSRGLLVDEKRKLEKKKLPKKSVRFSEKPPKVHVMRVWAFAARQARAGHWERHALDRERFKRRIADVEMAVSWVLKPQHRARVMFQRFMPWWNAQKRKELEESNKKEEKIEQAFKQQQDQEEAARRKYAEKQEAERLQQYRKREMERITEERRRETAPPVQLVREVERLGATGSPANVSGSIPSVTEESTTPAPQFERLPRADVMLRVMSLLQMLCHVKRAESMSVVKTPKRTPSFTTRRRTQSFRRHRHDMDHLPPVEIEGYVERKQEAGCGGVRATVRSWRGQLLCFFRDQNDFGSAKAAAPPVAILNARCEIATDYTKRANVFRLSCADGAEYLFSCLSPQLLSEWVAKLSFHADLPPELQLTPYSGEAKGTLTTDELRRRLHEHGNLTQAQRGRSKQPT